MLDKEKPVENIVEIVDAQKDAQKDTQIDAQKDTQKDTQIDAQKQNATWDIAQASSATCWKEGKKEIVAQKDMQIDTRNMYRSVVDEVSLTDSIDSESDSSSSSSSSSTCSSDSSDSSSSDSDVSNDNDCNKKKEKKETNTFKQIPIKSEFDGLPPVEDLKISVPEDTCQLFGEIIAIVEELAVIKPKPDKPALREETVLFTDQGQKAFGKIFDVFGPVKEPHYTVRFNSMQHLEEKKVTVGMLVYYCPHSHFTIPVFLSEIMKMKPCDSNGSGGEHPDFSDDEEEKRYYDNLYKQRRCGAKMVQNWYNKTDDGAQQSSKRVCISNTSHTSTNFTSSTSTSTPSTSNVCRPGKSQNRNHQSQGHNEYGHWRTWRNNNQFNYASQFNTYQPPQGNPRDACFMYNTPPPYQERYVIPPFNIAISPSPSSSPAPPLPTPSSPPAPSSLAPSSSSSLPLLPPPPPPPPPQQYVNYNLGNSNYGNQYYPGANMSTQYGYSQHPNPSYGGYFNPTFYNSNQSAEFSHSNSQYTQHFWSLMSIPPPPPLPSSSAKQFDK